MPEIILTKRAEVDIEQAYTWWAENRSVEQAERWYIALATALRDLETNALRYALASENSHFAQELRQLNFGVGKRPTHRAIFTVQPNAVVVLRIRHFAQRQIQEGELE